VGDIDVTGVDIAAAIPLLSVFGLEHRLDQLRLSNECSVTSPGYDSQTSQELAVAQESLRRYAVMAVSSLVEFDVVHQRSDVPRRVADHRIGVE
jgi:hypothetical protein